MKKLVVFVMMLAAALTAGAKEKCDWKGKVVDEKGEPVAYANVAVLSRADSTMICGAVTGEDGTFNIVTTETDGIMMVAMLGYQTQYFTPKDGMIITLLDDAAMLQAASIQAVMPKTKLTGEGLQTNIHGSVLENVGTAEDVLAKTPGVIKGQDGHLEVVGKGTPLVYINGRRMTDATELTRLQSNEIQSVEVITNPGAQYDASVRAVVRIKTVRRQGEGFGLNLNFSDEQSLHWNKGNDPFAAVNVNYRTGGVDIFGGVNYAHNSFRQASDLVKDTYGINKHIQNKGDLVAENLGKSLYGNAGVNWQIADNHFLGGKLEWGRRFNPQTMTLVNDNVYEDGVLVDKLTTTSVDMIGDKAPYNLGGNIYYNGLVAGKLGIDINLDYYGTQDSAETTSSETSDMTHDASIHSLSDNDSRMYAAKAVLSYPIWMGQLQVGTEETFSRRHDNYNVAGIPVPSSMATVKEDNVAGFASYGAYIPKVGQFSAGLRYEHVHYSYWDEMNPLAAVQRKYSNWFPSVSYANVFGPVQLMLNYSTKTTRPNYANLSSAIRYNSRYIWQSGNAELQPSIMHNVSLGAVYKWATFMVNYTRMDNAMMTWSEPYNDEGVVLVKPRNIEEPYRTMAAYVNLTPTIGPWNINYTFGVQPQWLGITVKDPREASGKRVTSFNGKPIFFAQLYNTFTFKGGWQLELGGVLQSKGYTQNLYLRNVYFDLSAAVQKTLLKDGSLVLRLEGSDLTRTGRYNVDTDFGNHTIVQTNVMDTQRIKLSIRYNFNTAQSKYRGTGAGADTKARM